MEFSRKDCARARESVSAELDGELPELELEWQRAHLRVCPDCAAWSEDVQVAAQLLRDAPLEEPVAAWSSLPRRRRARTVSPAVAVASVAALAASVFLGLNPQRATLVGAGRQASTNTQPRQASTAPQVAKTQWLGLEDLSPLSPPRQTRFRAG